MTRIAYLDTFSGISGDMVLGAMVDAGLRFEDLVQGLSGLKLSGFTLNQEKVKRGPFEATRVKVHLSDPPAPWGKDDHHPHDHRGHDHRPPSERHDHHHGHSHAGGAAPHRHLADILELIGSSALPPPVKEKASAVFHRLAGAEAKVHGVPVESVHFHEVGAVDSIADIVGSALGLHLLGVEEVWCSEATVGTGTVRGAHGEMPLPAPATLELLRGFPLKQRETGFELTTPTGAAIATTFGRAFGPMPPMVVAAIGYGAGDDRPGPIPNVLRLVLGEMAAGAPGTDRVVLLETTVDDMSPQWIGYLIDILLEAGALDVTVAPIHMKKSRPGQEIRVLAPPGKDGPLADLLFRETTTLGIRRSEVDRLVLDRSFETVATPWGEARIKVGRQGGRVVSASPEYEDIQRIARASGEPLKNVHRVALEEFYRRIQKTESLD